MKTVRLFIEAIVSIPVAIYAACKDAREGHKLQ